MLDSEDDLAEEMRVERTEVDDVDESEPTEPNRLSA